MKNIIMIRISASIDLFTGNFRENSAENENEKNE